jgi:hypothetical protein
MSSFQIVAMWIGFALAGAIFYLAWRVIKELSPEAITMAMGALFTLAIVVITALLFIFYAVVQSRLRRQDDFDELRKIQMWSGLGGRVSYHFKGNGQALESGNSEPNRYPAWPQQLPDGEYKDTTIDLE